ncbi:hypothetical protein BH10CYA1_BH10CYA1_19770 [soil metagenome]
MIPLPCYTLTVSPPASHTKLAVCRKHENTDKKAVLRNWQGKPNQEQTYYLASNATTPGSFLPILPPSSPFRYLSKNATQ